MKKLLFLSLIAFTLAPALVSAGQIQPGDFSANARIVTYDDYVPTGIYLGSGETLFGDPAVISGDTYTTDRDSHLIYQNPETIFGLGGGALLTDHGNEETLITLGNPAQMAGIYITAGSSWSATIDFFDASNNVLGVDYLAGSGSQVEFAGWKSDAGLIAHIEIFDTSATIQNMFFKDLMTETPSSSPPGAAAPEPSSLVLFGIGGVAFAFGWRRRQRRGRIALSVAAPLALLLWSLSAPPTRADILYVSNFGNSTIDRLDTSAGSSASPTLFASGPGISDPRDIAFDSSGNLYVSNYFANTISKVDSSGNISPFAGGFYTPEQLAFNSNGVLFVANIGGGLVSELNSSGANIGTIAGFNSPSGLAFDRSGDLFVSNFTNSMIDEVDTTTGSFIRTFGGFDNPDYMAINPITGDLFVANFFGNTVSEVDTSTGSIVKTLRGFNGPYGVAFDSSGDLFVANNNIGTLTEVKTDDSYITFSGFDGPLGLAFEPQSGASAVPAPSSLTLLGIGSVAIAFGRHRRRRRPSSFTNEPEA